MKIGKDTVIIGDVPQNLETGSGCIVIGASDGKSIFSERMKIGRRAKSGAHSIAIGRGAQANVTSSVNNQLLRRALKALELIRKKEKSKVWLKGDNR